MRVQNFILMSLIVLFIIGCGKGDREAIVSTGTVNQPVNLEVQAEDNQPGSMVEWTFLELPENVSLSQYDLQPSNTSPQISFIPPDSGTYQISYTIQNASGDEIATQPFIVQVSRRQPMPEMAEQSDTSVTEAGSEVTETESEMEEKSAKAPAPAPKPRKSTTTTKKKQETSQTSDRADLIPKVPGRYTVQVSSWKTFNKAETVANLIKEIGYDAYVQRAKFPDTGKTWYRVRVGSFTSYEAAKTLRNKLAKEPNLPDSTIWVDFQRKDT